MKFVFNDVELDTDKPVYVVGRVYAKSWFPYRTDNLGFIGSEDDSNIKVKEFFISYINFNVNKDRVNAVVDVGLSKKDTSISVRSIKTCAFGKSPKEARDMYVKLKMQRGEA